MLTFWDLNADSHCGLLHVAVLLVERHVHKLDHLHMVHTLHTDAPKQRLKVALPANVEHATPTCTVEQNEQLYLRLEP